MRALPRRAYSVFFAVAVLVVAAFLVVVAAFLVAVVFVAVVFLVVEAFALSFAELFVAPFAVAVAVPLRARVFFANFVCCVRMKSSWASAPNTESLDQP